MLQVAVYGKGGVGKSTVSSNLSYSLSLKGFRAQQIGCDPKHDSTLTLTGGIPVPTVLDRIRSDPSGKWDVYDMSIEGAGGVLCIETGGPEPGSGCAGRGILTAFDALRKSGLDRLGCDVRIYDVLGDVVCGGFAVPMRPEYADAIYIVTSDEPMSVYAANNIFRGSLAFSDGRPRIAGLVLNGTEGRGVPEMVREFSASVGIPVVAVIPKDSGFASAEKEGRTVSELFPDSEAANAFALLAEKTMGIPNGTTDLYGPHPLTDGQLRELFTTGTVGSAGSFVGPAPQRGRADNGERPRPLCGNGAVRVGRGPLGAVITSSRVRDLPVIVHGPRSCGYTMALAALRQGPNVPSEVYSTDLDTKASVFGGSRNLADLIDELNDEGYLDMVVVTSCTAQIIGDDLYAVIKECEGTHPGLHVTVINGDEPLTGGDAHMEAIKAMISLIHPPGNERTKTLNIADDDPSVIGNGDNIAYISDMLAHLGLRIGTKLFWDCTLEEVRHCGGAMFTAMAEDTEGCRKMSELLHTAGIGTMHRTLPKGYRETAGWVAHVGRDHLGIDIEGYLEEMDREFRNSISDAKVVEGKRIVLIAYDPADIKWIYDTLTEAGSSVTAAIIGRDLPDDDGRFMTASPSNIPDLVEQVAPDLIIGPPELTYDLPYRRTDLPVNVYTHRASIDLLTHTKNLLRSGEEGWRSWGKVV